ncbi:MAG: PilN domain-containing protein [Gammaproteobacteria bacterium]|nr:PilN domain-containing protein [Gammaproteobacteria bacterium]MBU1978586.1 PilN domain-containing protein [Gammaproteobacteria bacterium]
MAAPILTLDFKRDPFLRRSMGAWMLLGGVCAGVAAALSFAEADQALLQISRQTAELQQEYAPLAGPKSTMDATQLAAEIKHANDIIHQLNLPWDKLFMALESTANNQVALLSIQPDARKQLIHISGEAKNLDTILDYIAQLRSQETLAQITLTSHEIKQQDPDKPVRFSLSAKWTPTR